MKELLWHNKKEINCEQCKQSFKDKFSFKKHLSIHEVKSKESPKTKIPIKKCDSCDKTSQDFKYIQGFYTHIKSHEEDVNCEICGKTLKNDRVLKEHIRSVHESKVFPCNECNKKFKSKQSVKRHMTVHELPSSDPSEGLHKCNKCKRYFTSENLLKMHIDLKHADNVFYCSPCDKTFKSKQNLVSHRRQYHATVDEKTCKVCLNVFLNVSSMNKSKKCSKLRLLE